MTTAQLIAELRTLGPGQNTHEAMLYSRIVLRFLADNVQDAQLADGSRLQYVTDFMAWLREVADAARISVSTKVPAMMEMSTRPAVRCRAAQPRWNEMCPRCGHVHQGDAECGEQIGGGRICRCEMDVPA
jgi:hypothetical protein